MVLALCLHRPPSPANPALCGKLEGRRYCVSVEVLGVCIARIYITTTEPLPHSIADPVTSEIFKSIAQIAIPLCEEVRVRFRCTYS